MVKARILAGLVAAVALISVAAYFWSDVNYFRAISFATGSIGIITMIISVSGYALNHSSDWVGKHILIPMAKTNFLIANMSIGRKRPLTVDQLTGEINKYKEKSDVVDAAFKDLFESK